MLHDLNIPTPDPALIYCDNNLAMHISRNPSFYERTKHIELGYHLVKGKLQTRLIHLLPISSTLQLADVLTKALPPSTFGNTISKLGLLNIFQPNSACQACREVSHDKFHEEHNQSN